MKLSWSWICCVLLSTVFGGQYPVSSAEPGDTPSTIPPAATTGRRAVPQQHPRLLGSRERLKRLTARDSSTDSVAKAVARETDSEIRITAGGATVTFQKNEVGGYVELSGQRRRLSAGIIPEEED